MEETEPLPTTSIEETYKLQPRQAPFTASNVRPNQATSVTAAYHRLESTSWPTKVVFADDEMAEGEDADLEFEFDPARVPRPHWACG